MLVKESTALCKMGKNCVTSSASPTEVELANLDTIDEGAEQRERLPSAGGFVGQCSHCGEAYGGIIQQFGSVYSCQK